MAGEIKQREKTLIIIKPDAVKRGLEYKILDMFRARGLEVAELKRLRASPELIRQHYAHVFENIPREIAEGMINYMVSGPLLVAVLEGENAVQAARQTAGENMEPGKCAEGTVRKTFGEDTLEQSRREKRGVYNLVHSSDSRESMLREMGLLLGRGYETSPYADTLEKAVELSGIKGEQIIDAVITQANMQRFVVHGIKRPSLAREVLKTGIKPLTPESGPCSFWVSGERIFLPAEDSPIFNYSGGHNAEADAQEFNLAVTSYNLASMHNVNLPAFEQDSCLQIREEIPFSAISLLNVRVENRASPRETRKQGERLMILGLYNSLFSGICNGKEVKYRG